MIRIFSITLIVLFLAAPLSVSAQTSSCSTVTSTNFNQCCGDDQTGVQTDAQLDACRAYYANPDSVPTTATVQKTGVLNNIGTRYQPSVTLDYASNGSGFGGLSFKGVGSALVACTGLGNALATFVTTGINFVKGRINSAIAQSNIPILSGLFGGTPGESALMPSHTQDDNLQNKAGCLDGIAYVLSQQVLQQITNRTLNWVNTGFGGNPLYIKDIDSFLHTIRNQKLSGFLNSVPGDNPIFGNALRSVVTQQVTGLSDGLINKALNTPQAKEYNSFMGDFTTGGWNSFLNPANNPIGAFFDSVDNLGKEINTAQQNTKDELAQGNGFLNMKTCVLEAPPTADTEQAIKIGLSSETNCLKSETITPGSIIGQQVSNVTNSPVRQAELATHFNEAVGAFFDSLLNQLFSRGLSGVKGLSNTKDIGLSGGGLGSNVVLGPNGQPLGGANDNVGGLNDISAASATIDISRPQLIRAVLKKQYDYSSKIKDSRVIVDRLLPEMGQLDYCLPGPNPSWKTNLNQNFTAFLRVVIPIKMIFLDQVSYRNDDPPKAIDLMFADKVSGGNIRAFPADADEDFPVTIKLNNVSGVYNVAGYLQDTYNAMVQYFTTTFSRNAIGDAFASTKTTTLEQDYARGMATDIYDEVSNLPALSMNIVSADEDYDVKIQTTEQDIQDLEAIHRQVSAIVAKAKTRYIAEQKAAGTPVNVQCLDTAYAIDDRAITAVPRNESDVPNPILQKMLDANRFFYSQKN